MGSGCIGSVFKNGGNYKEGLRNYLDRRDGRTLFDEELPAYNVCKLLHYMRFIPGHE